MRLSWLATSAALLVAVLPGRLAAQQVAPEGSNFHNGSSLPLEDEGAGRRRLSRLAAALARADAEEVVAELRGLRADRRIALVPFGPRTHVPALDLAALMIVASDSESVRERAEADTRQLVEEARRNRDIEALIDLATRGPALAAAHEAALAAARLLFERGSWWEAERLAARAGELPDAAEIAAAARARAAPTPSREPSGTSWTWSGAATLVADAGYDTSLPALIDGPDEQLLVLDGRGLHSIDRRTGLINERELDWNEVVLGDQPRQIMRPEPHRFDMARVDQRLLIGFNALVATRWPDPARRRTAHLLGADLGSLPRLAFSTQPEPDHTISSALGPLTVSGPRVFAQLFRVGLHTEVSLVCFDARDGRLLWETPLVLGAQVRRFAGRRAETDPWQLDKRAKEGAVVERDGIVYACTGHGVVAAVDALTGRVGHTFRYDRVFSQDAGVYDPAFLFDTGGWDDEPARLYGDRLVVAPGDSRFLYTLALSPGPRGHLILDDPIERLDRRHVVALLPDPGGSDSPAVLATRRRSNRYGLVLIGPGGDTLAETPLLPEELRFYGRPLHLASRALVATSLGVLEFDPQDLSARPVQLAQHSQAPSRVRALFPSAHGLVTLSPLAGQTSLPGHWYIQWYTASR